MGFYGNITNTVKTNLQFDKKYSNRFEMEQKCPSDGVYAGRYVLVEYDLKWDEKDSITNSDFVILYYNPNASENKYSTSYDGSIPFSPVEDKIYRVVQLENWVTTPSGQVITQYYTDTYYIGVKNESSGLIELKVASNSSSSYVTNFNIDNSYYGEGRGWDSTVWMKTYDSSGNPEYINVAELNSIIPTFNISVDAPTEWPQAPHFDEADTNIFYTLHLQPQWGFRIAEQEEGQNSDVIVSWNTKEGSKEIAGAINYNGPAFEPYQTEHKHDNGENYFTIRPTGVSGAVYNTHDGMRIQEEKEDIQEVRINLPAIGNMMSDAWDIIHGPNRDDSTINSLQGRLDFFTKEIKTDEIPVQHQNGYLVGAHIEDDEWIATEIDSINKKIMINHTFNKGQDLAENLNVNGQGDTINLYMPEVDAMGHIVGKTTTEVTLPYSYKTISLGANSEETTEIVANTASIVANNTQDVLALNPGNKWIRMAGQDDTNTIIIAHEVHTIEEADKVDTNLDGIGTFVVQDLIFDEAGHVTANQQHKYIMPNSFRNIEVQIASNEQISNGQNKAGKIESDSYNDTLILSAQNRWIGLNANNNTIAIGHMVAGNEKVTAGDTVTSTPAFGEKFTVPYVKYDELGHIASSGVREVMIPKGSLSDSSSSDTANILTSIAFDEAKGQITTTHQNVGALKLTDYITVDSNDNNFIQATDTINSAFKKIDNRFNGLDFTDEAETSEIVQTVNQVNGKITVEHKDVGSLTLKGYNTLSSISNNGALTATDSINNALGKLEFRLNDLDVTDVLDNTKVISLVTQSDGKITTNKTDTNILQLSSYSQGSNSTKIANSDTINLAFGKLQNQIDNILGSGTIAENFNSIKEIADWLIENDSNADKIIDAIATLNGDEQKQGSVQYQIKDAINSLDSEQTANNDYYISGIKIENGKLTQITEKQLPVRSVAAGASSGTIAVNGSEVIIPGWVNITSEEVKKWNELKTNVQPDWNADSNSESAILNKPTDLVSSSQIENMVEKDTTFVYPELIDKAGVSISSETTMTIQTLLNKVAELEERIYALEHPEIQPEEEIPTE